MAGPQSEYDPGFAAFGGGTSGSLLHPVTVGALLIGAVLMFVLPRRYVIVPMLLGILLIPWPQNLYIAGSHFFVARLFVLFGWARVLFMMAPARRLSDGFNTVDKFFLIWALCRAVATTLQFMALGAVVNQAGALLDALGGYFVFRRLIRDDLDVELVVKVFAFAAAIMAVVMIREQMTGQNLFGLLGGIRTISDTRNGKIRAQGAFSISIIAGSFGAVSFPLFIWLWKRGKARSLALLGAVSSVLMTFASASSTPISALLAGVLAIFLWPIRRQMRLIRWGIVAGLVALQIVMKAPVWYVLSRIDFVGGSSGWERANLIDQFVRHTSDWLLIGTHNNANWGWDMWDAANQFVAEGEAGGLIVLICFIALIACCFRLVGKAGRAAQGDRSREWQFWLLGVAMFTQVMVYMGIDYFDQSKYFWYLLLVILVVATKPVLDKLPKQEEKAAATEWGWDFSAHPLPSEVTADRY